MDGGEVSTGTIEYLAGKLNAREIAVIPPGGFYLYSVPGPMELVALFRPHTRIENGLIAEYHEPVNLFHCAEAQRLVLFSGREPNLRWDDFGDCIFSMAADMQVHTMCFVGSVAGTVPHTREPRFHASVSEPDLHSILETHGIMPSNYEGPASFVTYLTTRARKHGIRLTSLVAEIPAYLQGRNVACILAAVRKVSALLDLSVDTEDLTHIGAEFTRRLDDAVRERSELAGFIRKIEQDYDREELDSQMADLKAWFEKQDIRLD